VFSWFWALLPKRARIVLRAAVVGDYWLNRGCVRQLMSLLLYRILYAQVWHMYTVQYSTAQHSTAQHSTAQHSTAQHSTAQHSTATAQHSTAQLIIEQVCGSRLHTYAPSDVVVVVSPGAVAQKGQRPDSGSRGPTSVLPAGVVTSNKRKGARPTAAAIALLN